MNFLFLDTNARSVAMGQAYTALAQDANALFYNPAGLAKVRRNEATLSHNQYFQGLMQENLSLAAAQGWGLSADYLEFGNIQKTTLSNPSGTGLGTTGLTDTALSGGYARALGDFLSVGGAIKFVQETIDHLSAEAIAADVGVLYRVPWVQNLDLGLSIQNMGPSVKYQSSSQNLPLNVRTGAGYRFRLLGHDNTVGLDLSKERSESVLVGVGLESVIAKALALRLGYTTRDNDATSGISAGLGYERPDYRFDYAFVPFGDLGITQRLTATFRWGVLSSSN